MTLVDTCVQAHEEDYVVWSALENGLSKLTNVFNRHNDSKVLEKLEKYICQIFEPLAGRLGWEPKKGEGKKIIMWQKYSLDSQICLLRTLVHETLAKAGYRPTIEACRHFFHDFVDLHNPINPEMRSIVFNTVVRNEGKEVQIKFLAKNVPFRQ